MDRPRLEAVGAEPVGAEPRPCPLWGVSTSPSPPHGGEWGGSCAQGGGCSGGCSRRCEPFPFPATKSGVGEAAQPGGHCPVPPRGAVIATFPSPKPPPSADAGGAGVLLLLSLGEFSRELSPPAAPAPFCPHPWGLAWVWDMDPQRCPSPCGSCAQPCVSPGCSPPGGIWGTESWRGHKGSCPP